MSIVNRRPFRRISAHFGLSLNAVIRHHDDHLPEMLAKAREAEETAHADDLLAQVKALRSKAMALLMTAERAGDLRTALRGVAEARACIELLAEMSQKLDRRPVVNLLLAPEWLAVRSTLIRTLEPYPEARRAVVASLVHLEAPA